MSNKYCCFCVLLFLFLTNFSSVYSQVLDNDIILVFDNENSKVFQSDIQDHLNFYISDISNNQKINEFIKKLNQNLLQNNSKQDKKVTNLKISCDSIINQRKASINFSEPVDKKYLKSLFINCEVYGVVIYSRFRLIENIDNHDYYNTAPQPNSLEWYNKRIEDLITKVLWVKQNPDEYNKVKENGWLQKANDAIIKANNEKENFLQSMKK